MNGAEKSAREGGMLKTAVAGGTEIKNKRIQRRNFKKKSSKHDRNLLNT